jgi:hypothetical protein
MPLSLAKVQEMIRQDREARVPHTASHRSIRQPLTKEQRRKLLMRPLPPTIYKCPVSEATTTIVPYRSLPKRIQDKVNLSTMRIFANDDDQDAEIIVEIPVQWTLPVEAGDEASLVAESLGDRRRQGNLRDKLTEYTRGSRMQQAFKPGGLGATKASSDPEDPARSEETIARNRKVLEQDTATSWRQGILLVAPPGVSFNVGLSWGDVHGQAIDAPAEEEKEPEIFPLVQEEMAIISSGTPLTTVSTPLFNKSYFDDDSLFGSSSEEEEEEEDGDIAKEEDTKDQEEVKPGIASFTHPLPEGSMDGVEDIDGLLAELTLDPMKRSAHSGDMPANPLELAERQARDQRNTTRKAWANTKYLPIRDFDALIPNPALVYPFTLDDFQQQAVARLERNEVSMHDTRLEGFLSTCLTVSLRSLSLSRPILPPGRRSLPSTPLLWQCVEPHGVFTPLPSKRFRTKSFETLASSLAPR